MQDWQLAGRPGRIFKFGDGPTHRDCQRRMLSVPVQAARPVFASHVWPAKPGLHSRTRTHMPGPSGLPAFRRLPTWPCLPDDEGVRARRKQKNKSTGKVEHRFKTLPPSTVTTTEQGQAKKLSNNKKLMALSLGSSCMFVDLTQHSNQVMYAYITNFTPIITCFCQKSRLGFNGTGSRLIRKESWNSTLVSCR